MTIAATTAIILYTGLCMACGHRTPCAESHSGDTKDAHVMFLGTQIFNRHRTYPQHSHQAAQPLSVNVAIMRLTWTLPIFAALFPFSAPTGAMPSVDTLERRQVFVHALDGIQQPTAGSAISGGSVFPFEYVVSNFCEAGYTPFNIYLLAGPNPPTASSLNSTQGFSEYLAYYGQWLQANFGTSPKGIIRYGASILMALTGLPTMAPGLPPPTFTMPVLDTTFVGTTLYLAVVQTELDCPVSSFTMNVRLAV